MRILILGGDGYLGWPTAMYFSKQGHEVAIADNLAKRTWEAELGVEPLLPIRPLHGRIKRWKEVTGKEIGLYVFDIAENHRSVYQMFDEFRPDAIVHYAEQPSAPYSMMSRESSVSPSITGMLMSLMTRSMDASSTTLSSASWPL